MQLAQATERRVSYALLVTASNHERVRSPIGPFSVGAVLFCVRGPVAHHRHFVDRRLRLRKRTLVGAWRKTTPGVRREKAALFPVGASPTRQPLQPEATGAIVEVTKRLKPSVKRVTKYGDSASVQAVTRVNAEQASKTTMRRPTREPCRGRLIRLGE
jgi:hypothetical protein